MPAPTNSHATPAAPLKYWRAYLTHDDAPRLAAHLQQMLAGASFTVTRWSEAAPTQPSDPVPMTTFPSVSSGHRLDPEAPGGGVSLTNDHGHAFITLWLDAPVMPLELATKHQCAGDARNALDAGDRNLTWFVLRPSDDGDQIAVRATANDGTATCWSIYVHREPPADTSAREAALLEAAARLIERHPDQTAAGLLRTAAARITRTHEPLSAPITRP